MMEVTITGADEVERKVRELAQAVPNRVAAALHAEADAVMKNSIANYVPVVTGALKRSGIVQPAVFAWHDISVTCGYGGAARAYALSVHENPRAGKTGGWGPKGPQEIAFRWIKGRVVPIGAQRKRWSRVGQWKYLEQPFLMRVSGFAARVKARVLQEGM